MRFMIITLERVLDAFLQSNSGGSINPREQLHYVMMEPFEKAVNGWLVEMENRNIIQQARRNGRLEFEADLKKCLTPIPPRKPLQYAWCARTELNSESMPISDADAQAFTRVLNALLQRSGFPLLLTSSKTFRDAIVAWAGPSVDKPIFMLQKTQAARNESVITLEFICFNSQNGASAQIGRLLQSTPATSSWTPVLYPCNETTYNLTPGNQGSFMRSFNASNE